MTTKQQPNKKLTSISTIDALSQLVDYSFMDSLNRDPESTDNGVDHEARQVFSGHYVPVKPTPIKDPEYITHSFNLFDELGFNDALAKSSDFISLFSGDTSMLPEPMSKVGWATGYALSIYGVEFIHQCPFQTGNGYGDGRAISIVEAVLNGKRWEMQLKGGGQTPYCRGADGRAVLRSSIREFLAQEFMFALGIPTSRSLSLYVSKTETVKRQWYQEGSHSEHPDTLIDEPVAISTRVAPSFIRVGQLELFARRTREENNTFALQELEKIVLHLIEREYANEIDPSLPLTDKVLLLAEVFRARLITLITNWIRVGYCQGNFNSDNCAAGGYTLDYGPFGFCEQFDPQYQPWTGGGNHFCFLNQPKAAHCNFDMFCSALRPLLAEHPEQLQALADIQSAFAKLMHSEIEDMWAAKLGLSSLNNPSHQALLSELLTLMIKTGVDYTIFFRELSSVPKNIRPLQKSFYPKAKVSSGSQQNETLWVEWFIKWKALLKYDCEVTKPRTLETVAKQMQAVNPKYTLREWLLKSAYQQAITGDYSLVRELQVVMSDPYAEQSQQVQEKYYQRKPLELFKVGGVSHLSCSS